MVLPHVIVKIHIKLFHDKENETPRDEKIPELDNVLVLQLHHNLNLPNNILQLLNAFLAVPLKYFYRHLLPGAPTLGTPNI